MTVTLELDKHQVKVLRRILQSDRNELAEGVTNLAQNVADSCYDGDRPRRMKFKNLLKHTADAIQVLDAVLIQF